MPKLAPTKKPGQLWIIWPQESQIRTGFAVYKFRAVPVFRPDVLNRVAANEAAGPVLSG
ncbi:MAG: hypothetical protein WBD40_24240 [Tepidisphaeraceae bacterium]